MTDLNKEDKLYLGVAQRHFYLDACYVGNICAWRLEHYGLSFKTLHTSNYIRKLNFYKNREEEVFNSSHEQFFKSLTNTAFMLSTCSPFTYIPNHPFTSLKEEASTGERNSFLSRAISFSFCIVKRSQEHRQTVSTSSSSQRMGREWCISAMCGL